MSDLSPEQLADLSTLEPADSRVGAFFDLDHTVLHGSSGMLFTRYMLRRRLISLRRAFQIVRMALRYYRGKTDFTAGSRQMMRSLAGHSEEQLWEITQDWFRELLEPRLTQEGRRRIEAHRARGHQPALLSASMGFATTPAALALGLGADAALCTQLETQAGVLTGEVIEPMCYAAGKVYWAQHFAQARSLDLARSFFYTDSDSDLPMLRAVGHPVAVNPNRRLREIAEAEGWPIVFFY